jgi:hypothetical protein
MSREGGGVLAGHAKPLSLRPEIRCRTMKVPLNGFPPHSSQSDGDHGIFRFDKRRSMVNTRASQTEGLGKM